MIRSIITAGIIEIDYESTNETLNVHAYQYAESWHEREPITKAQLITMRDNLNAIIWGMEPQDDTQRSDT